MEMKREKLEIEEADRMAVTFKGLADRTRLRLLALLLQGEACVTDLAAAIDVSQSAVSHQLSVLRHLQFVSTRREGQQIFYRIDDEHISDLFQRALEHSHHINKENPA